MAFDLVRDNGVVNWQAANYQNAAPRKAFGSNALPVGGILKRVFDVVTSVYFIIALSPLLLGLCIALRLTSKGPLFYGHERIGYDGRRFHCLKFRSMVENGDAILAAYLRDNPDQREIWETQHKLDNDPRVTPIGAVLRKLSLDELPQIINVLRGEMSLVGPRPVTLEELDKYSSSKSHYLMTRPGITGLWQISGRSDTTFHQRICMDRLYVTKWSILQDLKIIFMTVPAVLLAKGAR